MEIRDFLFEIILFLASAVLGIVAQILPDRQQKKLAASLAVLLLIVSVGWVGIDTFLVKPEPETTTQPTLPAATGLPTQTAKNTPPETQPSGKIYAFQACLEPCNGSNAQSTFPSKTKNIYLTWKYENIPAGAHYIRTWSLDGREWVRYDCTWTGLRSGQEMVNPLTEPRGLASGSWEMVILVDDVEWLRESLTVEGKWDYWDPAGVFHTCYDR